jgi:hypothetical protein
VSKKEITPHEQAKLDFAEFIQKKFFDKISAPHFMGGSRRFGYSDDKSDVDLFVLISEREKSNWLADSLIGIGFNLKTSNSYGSGIVWQFEIEGAIHISQFCTQTNFNRYIDEHNMVDRLLKEQPYAREVADKMRSMNHKGSEVYRLLLALAKYLDS